MPGSVTDDLRLSLTQRIPVGTLNLATMQTEQRSMDATDVMGMLEPIIVAIGKLEAKITALEGRT